VKQSELKNLTAPLIGVDEVGRGCLAGPVVAAAVIFNSSTDTRKYRDSKETPEDLRLILSESIFKHHQVAIGWASVEEIDSINILQASFLAMRRAIEQLGVTSGTILVDGRDRIPKMEGFEQRPVIKGDQKLRLISAASIAAKVARDNFMKDLAKEFNDYGFEQHKGYGTSFHRQRIQAVGPSKWHRQSFAGVKEYLTPASPGLSR
jgi:ribonuclease HII